MTFLPMKEYAPTQTEVFVKVDGETRKYRVDTGDYFEARLVVIAELDHGFKKHGAVLALVT